MGAWHCPTCGHGRFLTQKSMRYCARPGCPHAEHTPTAAKPVIVDRRGEWAADGATRNRRTPEA